jgi:hypothetical protein
MLISSITHRHIPLHAIYLPPPALVHLLAEPHPLADMPTNQNRHTPSLALSGLRPVGVSSSHSLSLLSSPPSWVVQLEELWGVRKAPIVRLHRPHQVLRLARMQLLRHHQAGSVEALLRVHQAPPPQQRFRARTLQQAPVGSLSRLGLLQVYRAPRVDLPLLNPRIPHRAVLTRSVQPRQRLRRRYKRRLDQR